MEKEYKRIIGNTHEGNVIVDSMQLPFEGEAPEDFIDWADRVGLKYQSERHEALSFTNGDSDEDWTHVNPGDFVLLDESGRFHVCENIGDWVPERGSEF